MELEQHLAHYHFSNSQLYILALLLLLSVAVTFFVDWLDKRE